MVFAEVCVQSLHTSCVIPYFSEESFSPFQALDLTVQLMALGEEALIQTDAKYAYGARGR